MGETLDSPGRSARPPDPGWARLATLAAGASALVVAGLSGAFVNRALEAGLSVPGVPSVVLPPLNVPKPTVTAAPLPATRPPARSPLTAPAALRTSGRVEAISASAPPAGPDRGAAAVPVPVRTVRLAPASPVLSEPTVAAPRLATAGESARTALEPPAGGAQVPTPDRALPSVGPMPFLHGEVAGSRPFDADADAVHGRGPEPGRPANRDGRASGDGDVDRS